MDNAKIQEVSARLKRGEGWVGYRYSRGLNGEKLPSKFLYFAFYQGSQQKFVNSKTNDPEEAYRRLLDARRATNEGVRLLPSEVSRIRYEDLRAILLDYDREHKPRSITKRHTGETDRDGNKLTEETRAYVGLTPHDFRRSAARNLIKVGVDRRIAMKITGHKTEHIFERYNIKTTDDVREALIKVGQFKTASLARIG
jgi:integrase